MKNDIEAAAALILFITSLLAAINNTRNIKTDCGFHSPFIFDLHSRRLESRADDLLRLRKDAL